MMGEETQALHEGMLQLSKAGPEGRPAKVEGRVR